MISLFCIDPSLGINRLSIKRRGGGGGPKVEYWIVLTRYLPHFSSKRYRKMLIGEGAFGSGIPKAIPIWAKCTDVERYLSNDPTGPWRVVHPIWPRRGSSEISEMEWRKAPAHLKTTATTNQGLWNHGFNNHLINDWSNLQWCWRSDSYTWVFVLMSLTASPQSWLTITTNATSHGHYESCLQPSSPAS